MTEWINKVHFGDCRDSMKTMIEAGVRVNCIVTSPPYWRQRDYGVAGQLGLEQTPEDYVANMVEVFSLALQLLAPDGTLWLNLGDKWASGGNGGGGKWMVERGHAWDHAKGAKGWRKPPAGYKDKDLVGIPWMTAFALRGSGWYLRQCNIWAKPNCMPESVSDRSTASHEYVFQLSKSNDYFYDAEAARTPATPSSETRLAQDIEAQAGSARANGGAKTNGPMKAVRKDKQRGHSRVHEGFNDRWDAMPKDQQRGAGANLRSVWWVSPASYGDEHYAVMPDRIAEICIVAGTSAYGHCAKCGFGWTRIMEKGAPLDEQKRASGADASGGYNGKAVKQYDGAGAQDASATKARILEGMREHITLGWEPACKCGAPVVPGLVFDPFMGTGTTAQIAQEFGRNWIGCELNLANERLQRDRTRQHGLTL